MSDWFSPEAAAVDRKIMADDPQASDRNRISYGISPRLSERFQRSGKGPMFALPARLKFEGKPHFVLHHPDGGFTIPTLPVTAEMLRKHTRKFGPEGLEEVARWEGVSLDREIASKLKPKRRTSTDLERWILSLASDGMLFSGIARTTNVGIGRVRSILRKHGVELRRGVTSLPMGLRAEVAREL